MKSVSSLIGLTFVAIGGIALVGCQSTVPSENAPMPVALAGSTASANTIVCEFKSSGAEYKGTCAIPCMVNSLWIDIDGPRADRTCSAPPRTVEASFKKTDRPDHYLGSMQPKEPEDPNRFELLNLSAGKGIAKLPFGWFGVKQATLGNEMKLTIDGNKTLPATQDDLKIIQRAIALLPSDAVWNKADTRQCPKGQTKLSVFCALIQATEEISGGYHYRQPAMQAVREVVNEVGGKRVDKHRLMDYNNHPDTTLAEIHTMLRMAQAKVEKRFR
jgi:hypothetical protein